MNIKTTFQIISIVLSAVFASMTLNAADTPLFPTIAITQIADHPAANAVREGILAALKDNGYEKGKSLNVIYENAQGSPVTATQIAKKIVALKPDVIMPITTPSAQAMVKADQAYAIPIVFAAVTDPILSGVVSSLTHPGGYITGATDASPVKQQIETFKKVLPDLKTLGVIYNPGDNSSTTPLKEAREVTKSMGITLIEAPAFKTSDVPTAALQLAGSKVDAIFIPLDNTVLSAMDSVLKIGFQNKIPVFSSDSDSVAQGALASSGYTHFDTGYAAGKIAAQILTGAKPGDIPVATSQDLSIYINPKTAEKLNISIPEAIAKTAKMK
ncbi:MAG TPA: ABC transporter substrate-binding protein [Alphaproteobacteria bacterium]|nr:ABC transporter substrate-binding protein [Alphaproteobacteria bacterium]